MAKDFDETMDSIIKIIFHSHKKISFIYVKKTEELSYLQIPYHLHENKWMTNFIMNELSIDKKDAKEYKKIYNYIKNSRYYEKLVYNLELNTIINYIERKYEYLDINSYFDFNGLDIDIHFRKLIVNELTKLGFDKDVIEEGLERTAFDSTNELIKESWRTKLIRKEFYHRFYNVVDVQEYNIEMPSEEFRMDWTKLRLYEYYNDHKNCIDICGTITNEMKMLPIEAAQLYLKVEEETRTKL